MRGLLEVLTWNSLEVCKEASCRCTDSPPTIRARHNEGHGRESARQMCALALLIDERVSCTAHIAPHRGRAKMNYR
jgi:hypothetical protein